MNVARRTHLGNNTFLQSVKQTLKELQAVDRKADFGLLIWPPMYGFHVWILWNLLIVKSVFYISSQFLVIV